MTVLAMKKITGRHVLFGLFAFFGVMLLANGIFVYLALSTFNGLSNPNAYQDGVRYNERIEAAERQAALGWSHEVLLSEEGRLRLTIKDRTGGAVPGLAVKGEIARPAADRFTRPLVLEETAAGSYAVTIEGLAPGNWIVTLEAANPPSQGPATPYRIKQRLWLKPSS